MAVYLECSIKGLTLQYSVDVELSAICDQICENRPPCKICTLEICAFERGHVVLDPNFLIMPLQSWVL